MGGFSWFSLRIGCAQIPGRPSGFGGWSAVTTAPAVGTDGISVEEGGLRGTENFPGGGGIPGAIGLRGTENFPGTGGIPGADDLLEASDMGAASGFSMTNCTTPFFNTCLGT